jgi:diguanylate cyclase (GGDEF)-like protein
LLLLGVLSPAVAAQSLTLQLKWFHQFQFAGYYAAQMQGYYQAEDLDVNIKSFTPGIDVQQEVVSGQAQFGISDASIVLAKLQGKPVTVLAAVFQKSPLALLTLESSGLTSPLDLKNKRVMFRRDNDDAVIIAMFSELGITAQDYTHVPHNFNDNELNMGTVDAMSVYVTDQPYHYESLDIAVNLSNPSNYGIDFYGDMLFTSEAYLINHTQQALAFRRASLQGWRYALEHPEEVIDWMLANLDVKKSKEQLLFEAQVTRRMIKPEQIKLGTVNKNRFLRIANIYKQQGRASTNALLDGLIYEDLTNPQSNYKQWLYLSWAGIGLLLLIAAAFWLINRRLSTLVKARTYELEQSKKALDRLVITDELTGLGNRRMLNQHFALEIIKAMRYQRPLSIILFDIDHFKQVNDQHGHSTGDQILEELANLIGNHIRASDLLGRWGGEEFMIICPETSNKGTVQLADMLRRKISMHAFTHNLHITCSFGVVQWQQGESSEALFSRCDRNLYKAKEQGRDCIVADS